MLVHEAAVRLGEELAAANSNSTQVVKLFVYEALSYECMRP